MMNEACELNCVVFTMALRSLTGPAHGVLHRVSRLMRGNADRRDRGGIVNGVGEKDGVIARIVVVGQLA